MSMTLARVLGYLRIQSSRCNEAKIRKSRKIGKVEKKKKKVDKGMEKEEKEVTRARKLKFELCAECLKV